MSQESWQPAFPLIELLMVLCVIALLLPTIEAEHGAACSNIGISQHQLAIALHT